MQTVLTRRFCSITVGTRQRLQNMKNEQRGISTSILLACKEWQNMSSYSVLQKPHVKKSKRGETRAATRNVATFLIRLDQRGAWSNHAEISERMKQAPSIAFSLFLHLHLTLICISSINWLTHGEVDKRCQTMATRSVHSPIMHVWLVILRRYIILPLG